jgi:hypothetical protein
MAGSIVRGVFYRERTYDTKKIIDVYWNLKDAESRADRMNARYNSIHGVMPYFSQTLIANVDPYGVFYAVMSGENFTMASTLVSAGMNYEEAHAHAQRLNVALDRLSSPSTKRFYVKAIKVK